MVPENIDTLTPPKPPPSFLTKYRVWIVIFGIVCLFSLSGIIYSRSSLEKATPVSPTQPPTPTQKQTTKSLPSAQIQYLDRVKVFEPVTIPENQKDPLYIEFSSDFYAFGKVLSGEYKDGELLMALVTFGGPGKGRGIRQPSHLRFIRKGDVITFLPKISDYPFWYGSQNKENFDQTFGEVFQKFGLALKIDESFTLPILEYPEEITDPKFHATFEFQGEDDGTLNTTRLIKTFKDDVFGDVYTTNPELAPEKSFYDSLGWATQSTDTDIAACDGENCFYTNAFFVFRPDGTFLKYSYTLPFTEKDITWNDNKLHEQEYASQTIAGCNWQGIDYTSVVSPKRVEENDLVQIGIINKIKSPVFGLPDHNHKLYTEFYNAYSTYYAGENVIYPEERRQIKSFNEFINQRPLFLWKDPFGRMIRFSNDEFLPPLACEPIIYLYPQTTQRVSVSLGQHVKILDSIPEYKNGWNVIADPQGKIVNLSDQREYTSLFWEGWSYIFPIQSKGFVVKKNEVANFLDKTLPRLGLHQNEKKDFLNAWLPSFSESPYYFITFISQDDIERIAPLHISPTPDTVIRVLMDIKPLDAPIKVEELIMKDAPKRSGFTVVEWGGLKR